MPGDPHRPQAQLDFGHRRPVGPVPTAGVPGHVRSDNGPEFIAKAVRDWIAAVGAGTAFIEPGSPSENGYCESFNSKLRDELLNGEIFYSLAEARIVIEGWRQHYNTERPHSSLGYKPPAPAAILSLKPCQSEPRPKGRLCIRGQTGPLNRGRPGNITSSFRMCAPRFSICFANSSA